MPGKRKFFLEGDVEPSGLCVPKVLTNPIISPEFSLFEAPQERMVLYHCSVWRRLRQSRLQGVSPAEKGMRAKVVKRCVLGVIVLAVLVLAALYLQASRVPPQYAPLPLAQEKREQAAKEFVNHIGEFSNNAQLNDSFDWQITQDQINRYLASMDEIAANRVGGRAGEVNQMMDSVGLTDPAVVLDHGVLTLLVRARDYGKVVSADLSFSFTPDKKLRILLGQTRIGRLPIPDTFIRGPLEKLKEMLRSNPPRRARRPHKGRDALPDASAEDVGAVVATVIGAIDSDPITAELVGGINNKRVRVEGIDIEPGVLTLHVVPIDRKNHKAAAHR